MQVLLIGWGNALPSQLAAYERTWRAFGAHPQSVVPSTPRGLFDPRTHARALAPFAEVIARSSEPWVVHLFSDNGFVGWAGLLEALATPEKIRGVILDSSPGLWAVRGPIDFAKRFALGMTPVVARGLGLGARERLPAITPALAAVFLAYQAIFRAPVRTMRSAGARVARLQPRCPQLHLYGDADALVPAADVERWIVAQRERGMPVSAHRFAGARHVALYPADPARYRRLLSDFCASVS